MARRFVTLDVFTEQRLAGNPLAVVLDAEGLDTAAMQAIAQEFNLSETVFVLPPTEARHRASLRIFTPGRSCPSPATRRWAPPCCWRCRIRPGAMPGPSAWRSGSESSPAWSKRWRTAAADGRGSGCRSCRNTSVPAPSPPCWPRSSPSPPTSHRRHAPSRHGVGPSFTCVPVGSVTALDAARPAQAPDPNDGLYLYTPDPEGTGQSWRVRMFAPNFGVTEDPATGSAASAFAGVLMQFEALGDGTHDVAIRQGEAMGGGRATSRSSSPSRRGPCGASRSAGPR